MRRCWLLMILLVMIMVIPVQAEKTKLVFWSWDQNARDLEMDLAKRFTASRPHLEMEVAHEPWSGYWDKLTVLNANRTPPDIYYMSVAYAWDYANQNLIQSMEPFISELPKQEYFWPVMEDLRYPTRKGDLYAFPYSWVCSLLYYNESLFDANGLSYPNESWDWFRLREYAKKLTRDINGDGTPETWGFLSSSSHELLDALVYSWGGAVLDETQRKSMLNTAKSMEAIQFLVDLIHKDRVSPPIGAPGSPGGYFSSGQYGMQVIRSSFITSLRNPDPGFNWDVAMVPKGPAGRVVYGGPDSIAVSKYTKSPKDAWDFVRFFITQRKPTDVPIGKAPVYRPLALDKGWLAWNNPPKNIRVVLESSQYVRGADFGTTRWNDWRTEMNQALTPAFRGEKPVSEAVTNAVIAINSVLNSTTCLRCQ